MITKNDNRSDINMIQSKLKVNINRILFINRMVFNLFIYSFILLLIGCGKKEPEIIQLSGHENVVFSLIYGKFPTTNTRIGRAYLIHGMYSDLGFYEQPYNEEIVIELNNKGYDVITLLLPYTKKEYFLDGGKQYREAYLTYLNGVMNELEITEGCVSNNMIGGISFGGLHAMIGMSTSRFNSWFAFLPVTKLGVMDEYKGMDVPYLNAFNEVNNLIGTNGTLLWGDKDLRVDYTLTIQLQNIINVDAIEINNLAHDTFPGIGNYVP